MDERRDHTSDRPQRKFATDPLHLYCFLKIQKATHPGSVAMRRISVSWSSITKSLWMTEPSGPVLTKEPVQSASTV